MSSARQDEASNARYMRCARDGKQSKTLATIRKYLRDARFGRTRRIADQVRDVRIDTARKTRVGTRIPHEGGGRHPLLTAALSGRGAEAATGRSSPLHLTPRCRRGERYSPKPDPHGGRGLPGSVGLGVVPRVFG